MPKKKKKKISLTSFKAKKEEQEKDARKAIKFMIETENEYLTKPFGFIKDIGFVDNFADIFDVGKKRMDILNGLYPDVYLPSLKDAENVIMHLSKRVFDRLKLKNEPVLHNNIVFTLIQELGVDRRYMFTQENDLIVIKDLGGDLEIRILPMFLPSIFSMTCTDHYVFLVSTNDPTGVEDVPIPFVATGKLYPFSAVVAPLIEHIKNLIEKDTK